LADVSLWHVGPDTGYRYDVDALERLLTPKTRLIVVNTPHNPTGAMLPPDAARRVYALAESVGATVLGDEAYRWLAVPDGEPFAPPFFDSGERGISVGTLPSHLIWSAHRLDRRTARHRQSLLGYARLHHAQSGKLRAAPRASR
jgi:hypothetical protein